MVFYNKFSQKKCKNRQSNYMVLGPSARIELAMLNENIFSKNKLISR